MNCPSCQHKALSFAKFILWHPFKAFACDFCGTILKTGSIVRIFAMGTFVMIFVSFFYTFPRIDQMVHAYPHSHKVFQVLLQIFLPPVVIGLQVVVLFIPVAVYTWLWGKLEIAK